MIIDRIGSSYSEDGFNLTNAYDDIQRVTGGIDYDTVACTGTSGLLVAPTYAFMADKSLLIVRKPNDGSHSYSRIEGCLRKRFIIIDDFVLTGKTISRILDEISRHVDANFCQRPVFAGVATYSTKCDGPEFLTPDHLCRSGKITKVSGVDYARTDCRRDHCRACPSRWDDHDSHF